METLGQAIVRWRKIILIATLVGFVAAGAYGGSVAESLSSGGFQDAGAESVLADNYLEDQFGVSSPAMAIVITTATGSVDDPLVAQTGVGISQRLAAEEFVTGTSSYWELGSPAALKSTDGTRALIFVSVEGTQSEVLTRSGDLAEKYQGTIDGVEVQIGGSGPLFAEMTETIENDLATAEAIAFPLTGLLLVLIFGSLVAAALPLLIGGLAIVGTLAILQILTGITEVSIFALNLTTALGLGLAIDYSLLVVSRFREELSLGFSPHEAAVRTTRTAGRTVLFSAATVAASLSAMLVFDLAFLRSFGYAGIAVVAMAAFGAVIVLPATLATLGHRIERGRVRKIKPVAEGSGVWHRIAITVMRRPVMIASVAIVFLIVLGLPFTRIQLGQSDDRVLQETSNARIVGDILRSDFISFESTPLDAVIAGVPGNDASVALYAATLSAIDNVARVDAFSGTYVDGRLVAEPTPASARFSNGTDTYLSVITSADPISPAAETLVNDARAIETPFDVLIGGSAADFVDTKASLFGSLPWAILIIATVTFVLLFVMFGSVIMPIKAIILNVLSLTATFGALVWIFQDGNLADIIGFTSTGSIDLTMPILIFVIAFGLSMDYEVFLLSRIKEEYDRTGDNEASVALGLEKTGRIVTAAAVLIAVVFIAFATSSVLTIQMFGIGMTLAVLVDAFIVRATLVPAFMTLAGSVNWWAPRWMVRLHARIGISDTVELDADPAPTLERLPTEA
ncbi:MAG: MMPL family transporter [Acidobacteria bacterium]|nr:MMPL family transporter [Acidobacteriota bacterium]